MRVEDVVDRESLKAYLASLHPTRRQIVSQKLACALALRVYPISLSLFESERNRDLVFELTTFISVGALVMEWALIDLEGASEQSDLIYYVADGINDTAGYLNLYESNKAADVAPATMHAALLELVSGADGSKANRAVSNFNECIKNPERSWPAIQDILNSIDFVPFSFASTSHQKARSSVFQSFEGAIFPFSQEASRRLKFFREWHGRFRQGRDSYALETRKVLLSIKRTDWEQGPTYINSMFDEVLALYRAEDFINTNTYGFRAFVNAEDDRLRLEETAPQDMAAILEDIHQALSDFDARSRRGSASNLSEACLRALAPEIEDFAARIAGNGTAPKALHWQLRRYIERFELVLKDQDLPLTADTTSLLSDLRRARDEICVVSDVVRADEDKRMAIKIKQNFDEFQLLAIRSCLGMAADGEGQMRTFALLAAKSLLDPDASLEEKQAAIQFGLRMGVESSLLIRTHEEEKKEGKSKFGRALDNVKDASDTVVKFDKGVDAVQEAIAEGSPLGQRLLEILSSTNFGGLF